MPREILSIQVGQCGNQLGLKFWDVLRRELEATRGEYADAVSSLFHVESNGRTETLKARCVSVDMEEGVLAAIMKGPLQSLFDAPYFVTDVSGAGNNWAVGHLEYGDRHAERIGDTIRHYVEACDSLQTFLLMHSLSGGTGSGLGTRILAMLEEDYPNIFRFAVPVMPSVVDDVVIAPYNSGFALRELIERADCIVPLDNDALTAAAEKSQHGGKADSTFCAAQPTATRKLPFDTINAIAAQMLSDLTSSVRFPGQLNMDINDITTNMVPYPRMHFITTSLAPLYVTKRSLQGGKHIDAAFNDCLSPAHQLVACPLRQSVCLAASVVARGDVTIGDVCRNAERIRTKLNRVHWNDVAFKTALCEVPPLGHTHSVLMLANTCGIAAKLRSLMDRFNGLYAARSHVHHFEQYLELQYFDATVDTVMSVVDDYEYVGSAKPPPKRVKSLRDFVS